MHLTTTPPQPDELELSLFGPGIGECAVVHLGSGEWMVVDSCVSGLPKTPVALTYLKAMGVDISNQVKLVVVTHWHDDHIRGVAQILQHANAARFVCSGALRQNEFLTLVAADRDVKLVSQTSGVSEFAEALKIISDRHGEAKRHGPHHWAQESLTIYQSDETGRVTVCALSPSAQTVARGLLAIGNLVPQAGEPIRRISAPQPNTLSVVLKVCAPKVQFLLGGDLEIGTNPHQGWRAILNSRVIPTGKALAYKIAHHGSENADLPELWQDCLDSKPYSMLTPYAKGRKPLPSDEDVARLKSRSGRLFTTTWPVTKKPSRRSKAVMRTMNEITRNHWAAPQDAGHVRLRMPMSGDRSDIVVQLFEGAKEL